MAVHSRPISLNYLLPRKVASLVFSTYEVWRLKSGGEERGDQRRVYREANLLFFSAPRFSR